jgi:glycosyltransferase involved in cell wall biosynthesis
MPSVLHIVDNRCRRAALDQLARLAGPDHRILSMGPGPDYAPLAGRIEPLHVPLGLLHMTVRRMRKTLRRADLLCAWSLSVLPAALALKKYFRCPAMYGLTALPDRRGLALLDRFCGEGLALTVPTAAHRRALAAKGIGAEQVHVVPPAGIPADPDARARARNLLGLATHEVVLAAPGPQIRRANQTAILWAHGMLDKMDLPIALLLTDPGPLAFKHVRFRRVTGCRREPIAAFGRLSRPEALAAADVAVFASQLDAGLWALADAAAAGRACIVADTPWARDLLPPDAAAWPGQFQPRPVCAAMLELIESADRRRALGAASGAAWQRKLRAESARAAQQAVYARLLALPAGVH